MSEVSSGSNHEYKQVALTVSESSMAVSDLDVQLEPGGSALKDLDNNSLTLVNSNSFSRIIYLAS